MYENDLKTIVRFVKKYEDICNILYMKKISIVSSAMNLEQLL